jgi:hypothetical protein
MSIIANTKTENYRRSYKKLFDIFVQIGGFSNGIIFIAYLILNLYSCNIILWHCISTLISPEEIKENIEIVDKKISLEKINSKIRKDDPRENDGSNNVNFINIPSCLNNKSRLNINNNNHNDNDNDNNNR